MKKLFSVLLIFLLAFSVIGCSAQAEEHRIVASFYPMYIFAMNVFDGIDEITLESMAAPETGCLHDYQLLAGDMIKLASADAFIACGAGMEAYLPDILSQFPDMTVIDCAQGIALIPEEESEDEEEIEYNAHTWLDVQNAIKIVQTIADEASRLYPQYQAQIQQNAASYIDSLQSLDDTLRQMLQPVQGKQIVTFHEAFPYFAKAYGLRIAAVINEEHENTLSPAKLAQVIKAVQDAGVPPLFTEPQYSADAAFAVAAETGAKIYTLDPLASGEYDAKAYERGMIANAEALLEAFQ